MSFRDYLDEYKQYLSALVAFNTQSSENPSKDRSNGPLIDYLENFFVSHGFLCTRYNVMPGKYNLYVTSREDNGGLMLSGHTDTVGAREETWDSSPFELRHKDDFLYGLGTTDMKGYIALVMLFFVHDFDKKAGRPLSALFTCDEESSMQGAIDYKENYSHTPDLILIGESTHNTAVIAHKGYMAFRMHIAGRACHSSNPSLGTNAIELSMDFLNELSALKNKLALLNDSRFEISHPTLNPGVIAGGNGVNTVCPSVDIDFDVRPMGIYDTKEAFYDLCALTDRLNKKHGDVFSLSRLYNDIEPFECSLESMQQLLCRITGRNNICVNYCTEASFLGAIAPCAVLGPGSIKYAHSVNERIEIEQLCQAYEQLRRIYTEICS